MRELKRTPSLTTSTPDSTDLGLDYSSVAVIAIAMLAVCSHHITALPAKKKKRHRHLPPPPLPRRAARRFPSAPSTWAGMVNLGCPAESDRKSFIIKVNIDPKLEAGMICSAAHSCKCQMHNQPSWKQLLGPCRHPYCQGFSVPLHQWGAGGECVEFLDKLLGGVLSL